MTNTQSDESKYLISSVEKGLRVLEVLGENSSMTLKELTEYLNQPKTSLYRVILTLEHNGYIVKNENDQSYKIGEKVLLLTSSYLADNNLKKAAQLPMERLFAKYEDTINLGILSGKEVVYIDILESHFSLRMIDNIGSRSPAHATGLGKAILSHMPSEVVDQILDGVEMVRYTDKTLLTKEAIKDELVRVKERGYAFDDEEIVQGARCIAAPIFGLSGRVVGAVSITGPTQRFLLPAIEQMGADVKKAAYEISNQLGYFGGKQNEYEISTK